MSKLIFDNEDRDAFTIWEIPKGDRKLADVGEYLVSNGYWTIFKISETQISKVSKKIGMDILKFKEASHLECKYNNIFSNLHNDRDGAIIELENTRLIYGVTPKANLKLYRTYEDEPKIVAFLNQNYESLKKFLEINIRSVDLYITNYGMGVFLATETKEIIAVLPTARLGRTSKDNLESLLKIQIWN